MVQFMWVVGLGACGVGLRYLAVYFLGRLGGDSGLWVIFVTNILGSFVIGALYSLRSFFPVSQTMMLAVSVGFLGGLTTFSAFAWDTLHFWLNHEVWKALSYGLLTPVAAVFSCWAGYQLIKFIF
ncbi:MAG: CrcB family protein [Deltaproteobacteria bacterium]|nr:CrcB family protein [Deltaproteobacteria bacterium]